MAAVTDDTGAEYPSLKAAGRAIGRHPTCVRRSMTIGSRCNGRRFFVGDTPVKSPAAKPITIGKTRYKSHRAAAKALGIHGLSLVRDLERGKLGVVRTADPNTVAGARLAGQLLARERKAWSRRSDKRADLSGAIRVSTGRINGLEEDAA